MIEHVTTAVSYARRGLGAGRSRQLEETYGVEGAAILMDRPPGGWSDLVTNQTLDLKLDALEYGIRAELESLSASVDRRLRAQTWITTTTLIAGLTLAFTAGRLG